MSKGAEDKRQVAGLDALLSKYAAPESDTFEVPLKDGEYMVFKRFRSYSDLRAWQEKLVAFIKTERKRKPETPVPHPEWKELAPRDPESLSAAFTIHSLCVEPKLEMIDCFRLCKFSGWLVQDLMSVLDQNRMTVQLDNEYADALKQEKND